MKGMIRQRGSTYTAIWHLTDPSTGKRRQHSKGGFRTRGDAQKHLNVVLGKVVEGSYRKDTPLTVRTLLEKHWLPAMESRELRAATIAQYRRVVDAWIVPQIGAIRVAALTPAHVSEMVEKLRTSESSRGRQGLSARSRQLAVGVLKSATAWATRNGMFGRDPLLGVDRPAAKSKAMTAWTTDEARAFLASVAEDREAVIWALALTRGLRRGELAGLRWDAIDLDGGTLEVRRTRVVVDGKPVDSEPKTAAGFRSVPLDDSLVAMLRSHRVQQATEKMGAGPAYDGDLTYVAVDERGHPYHPEHFSTRFESLAKRAELRVVRLHDLRHTAASLMLGAGVPVKVVSEMLGHSSPTITLSIYQHTIPSMARDAGAALSASLLS
jgi:integrase